MSTGPGNHGQDDHSMMYISPAAGQPPNHTWRKEILLARGGQQLDNDVLSLAHGPQTDDRTPMPLAETSTRPCLRTLPSWTTQVPSFRHPSGCLLDTRLGGECDSPVSRRQLRYGQRPGGIRRLPSPICLPSHPHVPPTCTFQMYRLDFHGPLRGASWAMPCTFLGPIYSPLCHVSLNLGRVGARKP